VVELKNTGTRWGGSWMWRSWNEDGVGFYIFKGYGAGTEFNYFHGAMAGMNFHFRAGLYALYTCMSLVDLFRLSSPRVIHYHLTHTLLMCLISDRLFFTSWFLIAVFFLILSCFSSKSGLSLNRKSSLARRVTSLVE